MNLRHSQRCGRSSTRLGVLETAPKTRLPGLKGAFSSAFVGAQCVPVDKTDQALREALRNARLWTSARGVRTVRFQLRVVIKIVVKEAIHIVQSEVKIWKNTTTLDDVFPELQECVSSSEATIAVLGTSPISLADMPELKAIFRCGVGTDNIPFEECKERAIHVRLPSVQTRELIFEETASYAAHLVLKALFDTQGHLADWAKNDRPALRNRQVLVLGTGNIGRKVVGKLNHFVTVTTWDPLENDEADLPLLIAQADVVTLHMPLNEKTERWFDQAKLAAMKDGSALVNTARGAVVDEEDLFEEISSGRIRGLFDVFWEEPYRGKLRDFHPNSFYMSPHIASHSLDFISGLASDLRQLVEEFAEARLS